MSCIATSVGLGNIWRFPFTCYENGGGAFLIPYVFVLIIIGKPMYYMEMIVGQFTSRSSIKVWDLCPAFRGNVHDMRVTCGRCYYLMKCCCLLQVSVLVKCSAPYVLSPTTHR